MKPVNSTLVPLLQAEQMKARQTAAANLAIFIWGSFDLLKRDRR
jgi:hypothetical protein